MEKVFEINTRSTVPPIFFSNNFETKWKKQKEMKKETLMKFMQDAWNIFLRNYKTYCLIERLKKFTKRFYPQSSLQIKSECLS